MHGGDHEENPWVLWQPGCITISGWDEHSLETVARVLESHPMCVGATTEGTLRWVPGNVGVVGDEKADFLAKQGSQNELVGLEPCLGITGALFHRVVLEWQKEQHHRRWERTLRQSHHDGGPKSQEGR